jgi:hypothetical protein
MVRLTSGSIRQLQDNPAVSAEDGQSVWGAHPVADSGYLVALHLQ